MGDRPLLDYEGPRPKRRREITDWEFWVIVTLPLLVVVFAVIYFTVVILFDRGRTP